MAMQVLHIIALIGVPLVLAYTVVIYRIFRGKVGLDKHSCLFIDTFASLVYHTSMIINHFVSDVAQLSKWVVSNAELRDNSLSSGPKARREIDELCNSLFGALFKEKSFFDREVEIRRVYEYINDTLTRFIDIAEACLPEDAQEAFRERVKEMVNQIASQRYSLSGDIFSKLSELTVYIQQVLSENDTVPREIENVKALLKVVDGRINALDFPISILTGRVKRVDRTSQFFQFSFTVSEGGEIFARTVDRLQLATGQLCHQLVCELESFKYLDQFPEVFIRRLKIYIQLIPTLVAGLAEYKCVQDIVDDNSFDQLLKTVYDLALGAGGSDEDGTGALRDFSEALKFFEKQIDIMLAMGLEEVVEGRDEMPQIKIGGVEKSFFSILKTVSLKGILLNSELYRLLQTFHERFSFHVVTRIQRLEALKIQLSKWQRKNPTECVSIGSLLEPKQDHRSIDELLDWISVSGKNDAKRKPKKKQKSKPTVQIMEEGGLRSLLVAFRELAIEMPEAKNAELHLNDLIFLLDRLETETDVGNLSVIGRSVVESVYLLLESLLVLQIKRTGKEPRLHHNLIVLARQLPLATVPDLFSWMRMAGLWARKIFTQQQMYRENAPALLHALYLNATNPRDYANNFSHLVTSKCTSITECAMGILELPLEKAPISTRLVNITVEPFGLKKQLNRLRSRVQVIVGKSYSIEPKSVHSGLVQVAYEIEVLKIHLMLLENTTTEAHVGFFIRSIFLALHAIFQGLLFSMRERERGKRLDPKYHEVHIFSPERMKTYFKRTFQWTYYSSRYPYTKRKSVSEGTEIILKSLSKSHANEALVRTKLILVESMEYLRSVVTTWESILGSS